MRRLYVVTPCRAVAACTLESIDFPQLFSQEGAERAGVHKEPIMTQLLFLFEFHQDKQNSSAVCQIKHHIFVPFQSQAR